MKYFLAVTVSVLIAGVNLPGQTSQPTASRPVSTQPAYPLWDGNESVADYARRAGIKDAQIELKLDANVSMKLTLIPAGKFMMGSPESEPNRVATEGPRHEVTISKPFYMGLYEVTQEQYEAVMAKNSSFNKGAANPVENISWNEAAEFCKSLSAKTGRAVQLPTEAQWECACRAGTATPFYTGPTIRSDQANFRATFGYAGGRPGEYRGKTITVGSFNPNAFGLYDMHGNVWEWCSDWYDLKYYANSPAVDPQGPPTGTYRMQRGGSWGDGPWNCRCARRHWGVPADHSGFIGFRVVAELGENSPATRPASTQTACAAAVETFRRGATSVETVQYRGESLLTVWAGKNVAYRRNLFSDDNDHGGRIVDVKLSPDGSRVAFQWVSSGGHQPYRSPIEVVDVAAGKAMDVEKLLAAHRIEGKCPCWDCPSRDPNQFMAWQDNVTLLVPVCNFTADDMATERISLRVDK